MIATFDSASDPVANAPPSPETIAAENGFPTIRFLKSASSQAWVDQAIAHMDEILLDHAQCERKA
ncbi:MAG: tRNA isopentenyl-2-thiomethyl-A-37 hydroxylase MiaE, partial [Cyanobacteria bacterium P01_H01_bin.130]